jgi:hypothetical protein
VRVARLVVPLLVVVALAVLATAAATGARTPPEDGTLSIRDGKASMQLRMRGALIGRVARGQLVVTDPVDATASVVVRGAERQRDVNERTTIYNGADIRFRIVDEERFVVRLNAKGINLSAVGRGDGWLDGWGDRDGGIYFDGVFSQNGAAYRSIPDDRLRIELAAPPSSP